VCPIVGLQFGHDALHVALHCILGNPQAIGHKLVRLTGRHNSQHLDLARRKPVRTDVLRHLVRHLRLNPPSAAVHVADCLYQFLRIDPFNR
jgi:hypothetical protein